MEDEQKAADDGPEAVGAVADGVTEGEIFAEGEDGEDGNGDGDSPRWREEDDGDYYGHENKSGEDASASHGRRG